MPCCWWLSYITWLLFKCKQYPHVFQWTVCKSCCALFVAGKMWSKKCTQCIRPPLVTLGPADELLFGECALRNFLLSHLSTLHLSVFHSFQWHNHIGVGAACCDDFNWRAGPTPTPSDDSESSSSCDESSNDSDDFAWADGRSSSVSSVADYDSDIVHDTTSEWPSATTTDTYSDTTDDTTLQATAQSTSRPTSESMSMLIISMYMFALVP